MTDQPKKAEDPAFKTLAEACRAHYGARLVSLAVFGSRGRGTPKPDSDVDLLVVAEDLPRGRINRVIDFRGVEKAFRESRMESEGPAKSVELSPVFKTPEETNLGSPLFLDMTEDARILFDRDDFLAERLSDFRKRLEALGSRRIWKGSAWYWDLKPDFKPGEVFEL
jgi:uncharacterized protein